MAKKNSIPRQLLSQIDAPLQSDELEALRTQIRELQLEVDVLKETIEVLRQYRTIVPAALCGNFAPGFCYAFLQYIQYCCENATHPNAKYSRKSLLSNHAVLP